MAVPHAAPTEIARALICGQNSLTSSFTEDIKLKSIFSSLNFEDMGFSL